MSLVTITVILNIYKLFSKVPRNRWTNTGDKNQSCKLANFRSGNSIDLTADKRASDLGWCGGGRRR